jgi:hypothetical protein
MERSPFLPLPEGMVIGQVEMTPTQLTVEVISTQPCARCPGCGTPQMLCTVNTNERFTMFPVEGAASCSDSVCARFFAARPPVRGRCLLNVFQSWFNGCRQSKQSPPGGTQSHWTGSLC